MLSSIQGANRQSCHWTTPQGQNARVKDKAPLFLSEGVIGGGAMKYNFDHERELFGMPFFIYKHCHVAKYLGVLLHPHVPETILQHEIIYSDDKAVVAIQFFSSFTRGLMFTKFFFTYDP